MPKRKSTREHLLNTGAMIVGESGLRALTVRGLSLRAGTNTGSFVYHFGNREAFLTELLERWYEPLFTGIRTHANIHLPAFEKLEAILGDVMEFLLRHGQFIAQLVLDALAGEQAAIRFISGIHTRHPLVLLETIREAQQEGSVLMGDPMSAAGEPPLSFPDSSKCTTPKQLGPFSTCWVLSSMIRKAPDNA